MNMSCRSSIAPSIQLLKGAALLANSRYVAAIWHLGSLMLCSLKSVIRVKEKGLRELRKGLTLSPKLECSDVVICYCRLRLLGSSDPPVSASQACVTRPSSFKKFLELESCYVAQAGLKLLASNDPPSSVSQSAGITGSCDSPASASPVAGITGTHHHAQLIFVFLKQGEAGCSGSHLLSQHFGRPRQADHLRLGVRDQPGQHGETPSLLKIQNQPAWFLLHFVRKGKAGLPLPSLRNPLGSWEDAQHLHILELLRDGRDLLHAVLVRCQVALERLVLPQQSPHLCQRRRLIILLQQDLFFACKAHVSKQRGKEGHAKCILKKKKKKKKTRPGGWLTHVIPALREAEVDRSQGQEIETILANMMDSHSVAQARVLWRDLSSLQLLPPGSSDSPASASQVAGTTVMGFDRNTASSARSSSSGSSSEGRKQKQH
ncbi:hypothetical protein AAY473_021524 [Plecturocebus cupreus]